MSFSAILSKKYKTRTNFKILSDPLTSWEYSCGAFFTLLIARNTYVFSYTSLLQKVHWKSFHPSFFSHAHPCLKSSQKPLLLQTEQNTELLLLAPLLSLVIKAVCPPLSSPTSAPVSWDVTGASLCWRGSGHVGPQPQPAHVFACGSATVISRGKGGRGRPEQVAAASLGLSLLSLLPPHCFLESLGRMCADFLPWGSRAILKLRLWYKNDGWKGCEPAAFCDDRQCVERKWRSFFRFFLR